MSLPSLDSLDETAALNRFRWCLRIVVLIQCVGLAGRYLFSPHEIESDVYGLLFFDWQWSERLAQAIDNSGSWLALAAGCVLFMLGLVRRGREPQRRWFPPVYRWEQAAALCIAVWMLLIAIAQMLRASGYPELALAEHAVRYSAPLAIFLTSIPATESQQTGVPESARPRIATWLLVIAAAATFAAHGYKAIDGYGGFIDLIMLSDLRWTHWELSQATAERILLAIGWIDIVIGVLLIAFWSRAALIYMAAWGFITAASRMTAMGFELWPETLIRSANGGVPFTLLVYLICLQKINQPPKSGSA